MQGSRIAKAPIALADHVYEKVCEMGPQAVSKARASNSDFGRAFRREEDMLRGKGVVLLGSIAGEVAKFTQIFRSRTYLEMAKREEDWYKRSTPHEELGSNEGFGTPLDVARDEIEKWRLVYRNQTPEEIKESLKANILKTADRVMENIGKHGKALIHTFVLVHLSREVAKATPESEDFLGEIGEAFINHEPQKEVWPLIMGELYRMFPAKPVEPQMKQ